MIWGDLIERGCKWLSCAMRVVVMTIALSLGTSVIEVYAEVSQPVFPSARGEQCVEPVDIMRRDHFEFLKHQRDKTVREGIRTPRHSLAGCIDCHADKDAQGRFVPVNAKGQFCQSCHVYAAVKIDCFSCHAARPSERVSQSP
tara:strand:+ start:597 stop:1025 length:429 start_codon:yes stop_codon:yes gene_type:complete